MDDRYTYRGKRTDYHCKGEWVTGYLATARPYNDIVPCIITECMIADGGYTNGTLAIGKVDSRPANVKGIYGVDSETIGQCTGLKDKNGVFVYEGDILEFEDRYEWYRGSFFFKDAQKELEDYEKYPRVYRVMEISDDFEIPFVRSELKEYWAVVGNKWDNPELCQKKAESEGGDAM